MVVVSMLAPSSRRPYCHHCPFPPCEKLLVVVVVVVVAVIVVVVVVVMVVASL